MRFGWFGMRLEHVEHVLGRRLMYARLNDHALSDLFTFWGAFGMRLGCVWNAVIHASKQSCWTFPDAPGRPSTLLEPPKR